MNFEPMLFCLLLGCLVTLLTLPLLLLSGWKGTLMADFRRRNGGGTMVQVDPSPPSKWGAFPLAVSFTAVSLLACLAFPDATGGTRQGWTILLTGLAVFAIGLRDDFHPLGSKRRLALQALVAAVACFQGIQVDGLNAPFAVIGWRTELWDSFVTLGWLLLLIALFQRINSVNCLAGCVGLLAMGVLAHGAIGNSFSGLCAVGMAGALAGFLIYNLPPTRIRLGSSGSGLLGYLVGVLSITNTHHDHEASGLAVLLIAVLGASLATWRGALKLLPTLPFRPKPAPRHVNRVASLRARERR